MSFNNTSAPRKFRAFSLKFTATHKQQMLNWANQFNICCFMDNNSYSGSHHNYELIVAAGAWKWVRLSAGSAFDRLQAFYQHQQDWLFGHFGFGLEAETEGVPSHLPDPIGFPDAYFFVPEHLILVGPHELQISSYSADPDQLLRRILDMPADRPLMPAPAQSIQLVPGMQRPEYLQTIEALRDHIQRGDCYEINFCQEFAASPAQIDPVVVYRRLTALSPNPFAVFYKLDDMYLLCASPERYLHISGGRVWSQPIKGTAPRNHADQLADADIASLLARSSKERAENVMVVDLVRNDLSRCCEPGSVQVDELFGVYSFPQVHQLISTISGQLAGGKNWIDAVRCSFPMGSMTGAPKRRVLELIDQYEKVRRGIFSGAVGYCTPGGEADFNVVIRSILYNETARYLSCLVGSGITWYASPELEYEECLLKAAAMMAALTEQ